MKCYLSLSDFLEAGSKLHFSDHLSQSAWETCQKFFKKAKSDEEGKTKARRKRKRKDSFSRSCTYNATVLAYCLYFCSRREDNATTVKDICQASGALERNLWKCIREKDSFLASNPITSRHLFIKYAAVFQLNPGERAEWEKIMNKIGRVCAPYSPETVSSYIFYSLLKKRKKTEKGKASFSAREVTKIIGGSTTCLFRLAKILRRQSREKGRKKNLKKTHEHFLAWDQGRQKRGV